MNTEPNDVECDVVQLAIMAEADGEKAPIHKQSVLSHLAICETCRATAEHLLMTDTILRLQVRETHEIDLWPAIRERIGKGRGERDHWLLVALGLVFLKLWESFLPEAPSRIYLIIPLILAAVIFVLMRENPFRISTDLRMEEQT